MSTKLHPEKDSKNANTNDSNGEGFFATITATTTIGAALGNVLGAVVGLCFGIVLFFAYKAWKHYQSPQKEVEPVIEMGSQISIEVKDISTQDEKKGYKSVATQTPRNGSIFFNAKKAPVCERAYNHNLRVAG